MMDASFYAGRASGIRHAIATMNVLAEAKNGQRFGAKSLAARTAEMLHAVIAEESQLSEPQPDPVQP